ncbi:hypothetical protein BDA96_02G062000 [Sorghum bicolor]|uniref:Uncharacterized protein n=1 Tax=Sorghum bicolor TaxID=4558 RepID=A0A921RKR0_SORBI|nr:hypothetical protein BDA96_02G062000 [Sorghum bicolor]
MLTHTHKDTDKHTPIIYFLKRHTPIILFVLQEKGKVWTVSKTSWRFSLTSQQRRCECSSRYESNQLQREQRNL